MALMIKGIPIKLYKKTKTGTDEFNRDVYETECITVENVLVSPSTETEITDSLNLTGRKVVYTLALPKGDTNDWTDVEVEFFGKKFKTAGSPIEGIEAMLPLDWNKKVRVEAINE